MDSSTLLPETEKEKEGFARLIAIEETRLKNAESERRKALQSAKEAMAGTAPPEIAKEKLKIAREILRLDVQIENTKAKKEEWDYFLVKCSAKLTAIQEGFYTKSLPKI